MTSISPLTVEFATDTYLSWLHDSTNRIFLPNLPDYTSLNDLRNDILSSTAGLFRFAVLNEHSEHIGNLHVRSLSKSYFLLSVLIGDPKSRGCGHAYRALTCAINLFRNSNPPSVFVAHISPLNLPSLLLFSKLGFNKANPESLPKSLLSSQPHEHTFILELT